MRAFLTFVLGVLALALAPETALAAEEAGASLGWIGVGAGLAIGLGGLGCGIGQGLAGMGATEGIARDPGAAGAITTPLIITLALIESISLYAFVIGFLLQGKI